MFSPVNVSTFTVSCTLTWSDFIFSSYCSFIEWIVFCDFSNWSISLCLMFISDDKVAKSLCKLILSSSSSLLRVSLLSSSEVNAVKDYAFTYSYCYLEDSSEHKLYQLNKFSYRTRCNLMVRVSTNCFLLLWELYQWHKYVSNKISNNRKYWYGKTFWQICRESPFFV